MKKQKIKIDKEKYYYFDSSKGEQRITVCLLLSGNNVARGMSVCSYDDIWNDEEGKKLAWTFASRALKNRKNEEITNYKILNILIDTRCPFSKKGEKNPELSWYERKLLFGWKKMRDYETGIGYIVPAKKFIGLDCKITVKNIPIGIAKMDIKFGETLTNENLLTHGSFNLG